jgi:hypothetical protein
MTVPNRRRYPPSPSDCSKLWKTITHRRIILEEKYVGCQARREIALATARRLSSRQLMTARNRCLAVLILLLR